MITHSIPRPATPWLLAAVAISLVLHYSHLPIWMWGLAVLTASWRWMVHLGRWSYPGRTLKLIAVLLAVLAVGSTFSGRFSLESAAAFLIAACVLKLLEMRTLRDAYVVIFMAYFTLATGFLFEQELLAGLLALFAIWLMTTALISAHRTSQGTQSASQVAGKLLLASLPVMLLLYFLFPRLGPLWNVRLQSDQARTGLSESMAPGEIANLSQSDELAFRVTFENNQPLPRQQLYFRALTLDRYDGRRWSPSGIFTEVDYAPNAWRPPADAEGVVRYEVIQEPTDQRWLFALRGVGAVEPRTGLTGDDRLVYRTEVRQRIRYQVESLPNVSIAEQGLTRRVWQQSVQLPGRGNERARQWAAERYQGDASAFVNQMLQHFRQQPYFYTLQPPALASDDIDGFLFDTRRGFCAHYAGAMTFMLRSVGVPARVVAGYQGGEWNGEAGYLTVRQFDAHAWVEYWQAGQGWISVDPTAAVAPERIEQGLREALAGEEEENFLADNPLSPHRFTGISWLNSMRLQFDQLNFYWHRFVLSYDRGRQQQLLDVWIGLKSYKEWLYLLASGFALLLASGLLWLWWQQRPRYRNGFARAWSELQHWLLEQQLGQPGSTPDELLAQVQHQRPDCAHEIERTRRQLQHYVYVADEPAGKPQQLMARQLRRLHRRLARRKNSRRPPRS